MRKNDKLKELVHFLKKENIYEKFYFNYKRLHNPIDMEERWFRSSECLFNNVGKYENKKINVTTYLNDSFPWGKAVEGFGFWENIYRKCVEKYGRYMAIE